MAVIASCKYCGEKLQWDRRGDTGYCPSSTCRSKYHQEVGRGYRGAVSDHLVHEEKEWEHLFFCETCGDEFLVNDYALRSGKRVPMYCSAKCKQKAYRERNKLI